MNGEWNKYFVRAERERKSLRKLRKRLAGAGAAAVLAATALASGLGCMPALGAGVIVSGGSAAEQNGAAGPGVSDRGAAGVPGSMTGSETAGNASILHGPGEAASTETSVTVQTDTNADVNDAATENNAATDTAIAPAGTSVAAVPTETSMTVQTDTNADVTVATTETNTAAQASQPSFDVNRFVLPDPARVLVVVEGTGGTGCHVYAYEKTGEGWTLRVDTLGYLGRNGMSNHRTVGDKTTPIGLFQLNTPFGQSPALEGFPSNYIQVDESYVWEDSSNRLVKGSTASGEQVGTFWYKGHYDYVLDAGFNRNAIPNQGSALFLHCTVPEKSDTSGCVGIPKEQMAAIMRLYGTYGDGACYIAQAPQGTFAWIYDSYGANQGLSPEGNFS